jgi:Ca2+-binding EF-hand superfamily protein
MISMMKSYDFCDSKAEEEVLKLGFDDVFEAFDYDKSGKLDSEEIANCLALMCGGTINDKIYSAFNLFDVNNSMTLSFDELSKFVKCVFQVFYQIKAKNSESIWKDLSL